LAARLNQVTPNRAILTAVKPEDVRTAIVAALEADLIGPFVPAGQPGGDEEVLPLPPSR
jgi:hypothetical protein